MTPRSDLPLPPSMDQTTASIMRPPPTPPGGMTMSSIGGGSSGQQPLPIGAPPPRSKAPAPPMPSALFEGDHNMTARSSEDELMSSARTYENFEGEHELPPPPPPASPPPPSLPPGRPPPTIPSTPGQLLGTVTQSVRSDDEDSSRCCALIELLAHTFIIPSLCPSMSICSADHARHPFLMIRHPSSALLHLQRW